MTMNRDQPGTHLERDFRSQMWLFGSVLLASLLALLLLEWAKVWTGSGVQAYIRGNQRWTQAQKNAVIHLNRYAETGEADAYRRYREAIRVPLAYREARLALQDSTLDWNRAGKNFIAAGNQRHEVSKMIRLVQYLQFADGVSFALSVWEQGDALIDSLRHEARIIRSAWKSQPPDEAQIEASKERVIALDRRLSWGQRLFRATLHTWAGWLRRGVFWVQGLCGLLSFGIGIALARRVYRSNRRWKTQLEESEERYRTAVMSLAEGLVVHDSDGSIRDCNPSAERILGLSSEEIMGRSSVDPRWEAVRRDGSPFPGDEHPAMETLRTGDPQSGVVMGISHPDNRTTWISVNTVPMRDEKGDLIGVVASFDDITERRQMEVELREAKEEAEQMNRMKSALLANTSHEIRTPLTSILGFTDAIRDRITELRDNVDGSSVRSLERFTSLIERSGRRLKSTLDTVLNLSKLEAGETQLSLRQIELVAQVERVVELVEYEASESAVDLHLETDGPTLLGVADPKGLRVALQNLVSNALKYTEDGGDVWVRAVERDGQPVIEVEDNGIGMDPDSVPEVFEPFRQESEGIGRRYQGTGLGLTVTDKLVTLMGGSIDVETEKGEGSRFSVWLRKEEESDDDVSPV